MSAAQGIGVGEQQQPRTTSRPTAARRRRPQPGRRPARTPYLLLLPGMAVAGDLLHRPDAHAALDVDADPAPRAPRSASTPRPSGWRTTPTRSASTYAVFVRSFLYALIATVLALAISYPLAYAIAFKAGRWRNLLLVLVVAPFFVSFLLRTIAWKQILADDGLGRRHPALLHVLGPEGRIINTAPAVVIGITYNFLPFMILPIYASLERVDPRLMEAAGDLYANAPHDAAQGDLPAVAARCRRGHAADLHPGGRRLRQRRAARRPGAHHHGRQRHRQPVPESRRLPDRGRALGVADGLDPRPGRAATSAGPARRNWYEPSPRNRSLRSRSAGAPND